MGETGVRVDGSNSFHDGIIVFYADHFFGKQVSNVSGHGHWEHTSRHRDIEYLLELILKKSRLGILFTMPDSPFGGVSLDMPIMVKHDTPHFVGYVTGDISLAIF